MKLLGKSPDGFAFRGSDRWLEDVSKPVRSEAALDLIKKARSASPENPLYVVTVGAITNLASAMLIAPDIIENIVVVWLGGYGLNWPDQMGHNLRQNVKAAQVVFNSGVPFVHVAMSPVTSHFRVKCLCLQHFGNDAPE